MDMVIWWDVRPDTERASWILSPLAAVGPLAFGMSQGDVSEALAGITTDSQEQRRRRPADEPDWTVEQGVYRKFGLKLYYLRERLAGIAVDALRGPQVHVEDTPLVGQVPSVLEEWLTARAETREPYSEIAYMTSGVPGSMSLGVVIDVQRAGDHLLSRPVFLPGEAFDDLSHFLPREAWSTC